MREQQILTATNVAIKRFAIEVKVIKIGDRQVTQAVFKQLPVLAIIHPVTRDLRGSPWGRVNYHIGCIGEQANSHLHIVWQRDNTLYRCVVDNPETHYTDEYLQSDEGMMLVQIYRDLKQLDQLFIAV